MSDTVKLRPAPTPPNTLLEGEMALNEAARTLYVKTHRGAIAVPLDRMALEPADEVNAGLVYVYRATGVGEAVELSGGGGANLKDDRTWRVFGFAPKVLSSGNPPISALFEVTYPVTVKKLRVRVLSGTGALTLSIYDWTDEALGDLLYTTTVTSTGAGSYTATLNLSLDPKRYAAVLTGSASISVETIDGLLPGGPVTHAITMSET